MKQILKIEKEDIATRKLGENIEIVIPISGYSLIFDIGAAIEFSKDVEQITKAISKELLACTVCYKILPVSEMYSVDACSEECQNKIVVVSATIDELQTKHGVIKNTEKDFQHFLAYTGYSLLPENTIMLMREAYYAAWS